MAETYEDIVQKWYVRLRGSFTDLLMDRYKTTNMRLADAENIYQDIYIVKDEEAIRTAQELASKEGLMCGISSGTNVAAALRLAKKLGPGKTVVTILPDTAERYFSTPLFDEP